MKKLIATAITAIIMCGGALAQQKQGHVRRPKPRGVGVNTVVGQAQFEVQYAFNATDVKNQNTYIDLHCLLVGKEGLNKQYSVFLERSDSLYDAYLKAHPNAEGVPSNSFTLGRNGEYWSEYQYTEIFTEDGVQTFYSWMPWAMEKYHYRNPTTVVFGKLFCKSEFYFVAIYICLAISKLRFMYLAKSFEFIGDFFDAAIFLILRSVASL